MLTERRIARAQSFDASPIAHAPLSELSVALSQAYRQQVVAEDVIAANHRSPEEQMASLRFFDVKRNVANAAGIRLFGKNPRYFLPGVYIQ
jgi:ATP-dependent DNA helicase RecG